MKLRIRDNSLRFRLDQKDMETLRLEGRVESTTEFGPGNRLSIGVERCQQAPLLCASFHGPHITLYVREKDALEWMDNAETGFCEMWDTGSVYLRLMLEKDYPCLQEREGESDEHAFAWPGEGKPAAC